MPVTHCDIDGTVRDHGIKIRSIGRSIRKNRIPPSRASDPGQIGICVGKRLQLRLKLGDICHSLEGHRIERWPRQMEMGILEARRNEAPLKVDDGCLVSDSLPDHIRASDTDQLVAGHRQRLSPWLRSFGRPDATIDVHRVDRAFTDRLGRCELWPTGSQKKRRRKNSTLHQNGSHPPSRTLFSTLYQRAIDAFSRFIGSAKVDLRHSSAFFDVFQMSKART